MLGRRAGRAALASPAGAAPLTLRFFFHAPRSIHPSPAASTSSPLHTLIASARAGAFSRVLVISGSGLSASAGMSTFSTPGGLYERAARAARLPAGDGKKLFSWSFYEKRRGEALAFLAGVAEEAAAAAPTAAHAALGELARAGALARHFTLNIDGLARSAGFGTWHPERAPAGSTVELHGCVREVVCPDCGRVGPADGAFLASARARTDVPCPDCTAGPLRPRVLLYGDAEDGVITPSEALDLLEEEAAGADLILWVGLSFEQSASAAYFRDVRRSLAAAGRGPRGGEGGSDGGNSDRSASPVAPPPVQAIINPAASDAAFNLATALHYSDELAAVLEVALPADAALPQLVAAIASGLGRPDALVEEVGGAAVPPRPPSATVAAVRVAARPPSAAAARHGSLTASEDEEEGGVGEQVKAGVAGETAVVADARGAVPA